MKPFIRRTSNILFTLAFAFVTVSSLALFPSRALSADPVYEKPGTLKASETLEPKLRKGPNHEVVESIRNDGLLNSYEVDTPYGMFRVTGDSALKVLIHELSAITEMKKVETDDTAIASLKESGENTVQGLKNMFSDPEKTFNNAAMGVQGLFNRAKGTIGKREITSEEDSRFEQFVGLTKAKGQIATRFGVNMYSPNTILQEELDRLARADYLGGLGVGVATSFVPGVGGLILTTSGTARLLNEAINTTPPAELWLQNKNKLLEMGVDEDTVELFLNNPSFNPAKHTLMVTALGSLEGVANRDLFVKVALQASNTLMARIITETAILTAGYHSHVEPVQKLIPLARLTMATTPSGKRIILLPTDHLIWSAKVAEAVRPLSSDKANDKYELWTTGTFSALATSNFNKMGWVTHDRAGTTLLPSDKKTQ